MAASIKASHAVSLQQQQQPAGEKTIAYADNKAINLQQRRGKDGYVQCGQSLGQLLDSRNVERLAHCP